MGIFSRVEAPETVTLSGEEARLTILALRRSSETFSPEETFKGRDSRAARELRLADRIGGRLAV